MKQLRVLLLSPTLDGMLVHRRVTPSSMPPVPIYTPGWRETMWGKVSCLRKQHDGRACERRTTDLQPDVQRANHYTTAPPLLICKICIPYLLTYLSTPPLPTYSPIYIPTMKICRNMEYETYLRHYM